MVFMVLFSGMAGLAGADVSLEEPTFAGDDDTLEDQVVVDNETIDIVAETDSLVITQNVTVGDTSSDQEVSLVLSDNLLGQNSSVTQDGEGVGPSTEDGQSVYTVSAVDGEMEWEVTFGDEFELGDTVEDAVVVESTYTDENGDEQTISTESYDLESSSEDGFAGGTIGSGPVDSIPVLGDMGQLGVFLFWAIAVGAVVLAATAMYMIYVRDDITEKLEIGSYAAISFGSLGAVFSSYGIAIIVVFVVLLGVVGYLYKKDSQVATIDGGTKYID